jgi:glycoside hydrolase-like protein
MHRAVVVMIVSGYALSAGTPGTGHQPDAASRKPAVTAERPMFGFDTCKTPSLRTMRVWRSRFSAAGIYIGGENVACAHGYLSRTWVRTVQAMGWSLLPNYVGPQPPCDPFPGRIHRGQAAAQGRAAADSAIADATVLGIGRGSPLYYDMEAYNRTKGSCVTAVLVFLDAWTRQLNARGYLSGVYSSADAAIIDLRSDNWVEGHRLAKPQCVWIALWDNRKNVNTPGYVPLSFWPPGDRSKQYSGPHWAKVGGIKLNIDFDLVDGPVVREHHRVRGHHRRRR